MTIQVQLITSKPLQRQSVLLDDGTAVSYEMYFQPQQFGWYFNYITYKDWTVQALRICNHPNMLNQWRNIIPFGLACFSTQKREPTTIKDFESGASVLKLLDANEVLTVSRYLAGAPLDSL